MKEKNVELKIPVEIISKIDKVRKRSKYYTNMTFSDYVNMLLLKAVDDEQERMKEFRKTAGRSRKAGRGRSKVIMFPAE